MRPRCQAKREANHWTTGTRMQLKSELHRDQEEKVALYWTVLLSGPVTRMSTTSLTSCAWKKLTPGKVCEEAIFRLISSHCARTPLTRTPVSSQSSLSSQWFAGHLQGDYLFASVEWSQRMRASSANRQCRNAQIKRKHTTDERFWKKKENLLAKPASSPLAWWDGVYFGHGVSNDEV